ncbi:MAG TPA: hypothetical protein VFV23_11485 [Verrucomicrobiae bacterium]|nr:hypothetical protein [Verrucomicrobiae bacterium]
MNNFFQWLDRQRNSTRLSFLLQIICRVASSLLSLLWTPLLLRSMGPNLNGLFLNFQKWTTLGNLGDLGMGGMVNIQTNRMLGRGEQEKLKTFLTVARSVFLVMAILAAVIFWAISPHLFTLLNFGGDPQTGKLLLLSVVGGVAVAFVVLNSYINNLNYGCGNILWPILPMFVLLQLAVLSHWLLARHGAVLWMQYLPYICSAALIQITGWIYVKKSHPALGTVTPLRFERQQFAALFGNSFWVYLGSVASGIWVTTDVFLITAKFGANVVPAYLYNNKLAELAAFVATSAGIASTPKITQWIVSPEKNNRDRGMEELLRLSKFQTFICCCAALVYLAVNDWFMRFWLGADFQAPLLWQAAFAAYLAVLGTGYGAGDMAMRCCDGGIRITGIASLLSALLNLGLSVLAVLLSPKIGMTNSIFGIAFATVIAQSAQLVFLAGFTSRQLQIPWWKLFGNKWLLALGTAVFGFGLRMVLPPVNALNFSLLIIILVVSFFLIARLLGISLKDLQREKEIFRSMFSLEK